MTPLRKRYIDDLRLKNFSPGTIEVYVHAVEKFSRHFGRSPRELSQEDIRAYLVHLIERGLARGTCVVVRNALRHLFTDTLGGSEQVLKYSARYTQRVAISSQRLIDLQDGRVRFRYQDYADQQQTKVMPLSSSEFIRRFLMHTLPSGFVRIRYYGLLANRDRQERLDLCRSLLGVNTELLEETEEPVALNEILDPPQKHEICPACGSGRLVIVDAVPAVRPLRRPFFLTPRVSQSPHSQVSSRAPPKS